MYAFISKLATAVTKIALTVTAPTTTGAVNINATKDGVAYTGGMSCILSGPSGQQTFSTVPATLSNQAPGTYTLSCTAPSGTSLTSIAPAASQTLAGGGAVSFAVSLTTANTSPTGTINVQATLNGQPWSGSVSYFLANSPNSQNGSYTGTSVPITTTRPIGTFTASILSGPGNLASITPSASQVLASGSTITFTLNFTSVPTASFTLTPTGTSSSLPPGSVGGTASASVAYSNMPTGTVITQTIQNLPAGVTASTDSKTISGSGTATMNSNFTVSASAQPGTYAPVASVTAAGITKTYTLSLIITAPPPSPLTGSCLVNGQSGSLTLQVGNQATFLANTTGGTGSLHYVWSGISGNDSNAASQIYNNAGTYNVSVVVSDSGSPKQQSTLTCPQVTVTAPPTTGTVNITVSGYSGTIGCTLNGTSVTAPTSLTNKAAGSYALSCTPPSGYNVSSITPAATQTLSGGGSVSFAVSLAAIPPSTGTITITTSGYSGNVSCVLNGPSGSNPLAAPTSLSGQTSGSYTLSCTAPSGYNITGITPSPTQTLAGGGSISFAVAMTAVPKPPTLTGTCTVNGQTSPLSVQVGTQVTWNTNMSGGTGSDNFVWSGISAGNTASVVLIPNSATTYNLSVVVSDSGSPKQQVSLACPQVTVVAPPAFSGSCNISPNPGVLGSGETVSVATVGGVSPLTFTINGANTGSANSMVVMASQTGTFTTSFTARDGLGRTVSGSCSAQVNMPTPSISGYSLGSTPKHATNFNMTISGANFVSGAAVYFYGPGCPAGGCQQPPVGVVVNNPSPVSGSISVTNIKLGSGSYYFRVMNPGGYWSGNSASFSVQ